MRIAPDTYQMAVVRFNYYELHRPHSASSSADWRRGWSPRWLLSPGRKRCKSISTLRARMAFLSPVACGYSRSPGTRHVPLRHRAGLMVRHSQSWLAGLPVDEIVPMASLWTGNRSHGHNAREGRPVRIPRLPGQHWHCARDDMDGRRRGHGTTSVRTSSFVPGPMPWSPETVKAARKAILP